MTTHPMTPEAQRIAIAEACPRLVLFRDDGKWIWNPNDGEPIEFDPLNDLNAMHEAEKTLFGRNDWAACRYEEALQKRTTSWAWYATAAQRAEAFLRVLGQWEP